MMLIIIYNDFLVSQGCAAGVDTAHGIWWPDTARNTIAQQKCPGGANSVGELLMSNILKVCKQENMSEKSISICYVHYRTIYA